MGGSKELPDLPRKSLAERFSASISKWQLEQWCRMQ